MPAAPSRTPGTRFGPHGAPPGKRGRSLGSSLLGAIQFADRMTGATEGLGALAGATIGMRHVREPRDLIGRERKAAGAVALAAVPGVRPVKAATRMGIVPWVAGRPWFHGSARAFDRIDPERFDVDSLYGPGHYITDNPEVASSYAGKGAGHLTGNYRVDRAKPLSQDPAWSAFMQKHGKVSPELMAKLQTGHRLSERVARKKAELAARGELALGVRRVAPGDQHVLIDFMAKDYGPNVTRYGFEPNDIFDIRAPVTPEARSRLVDALMRGSADATNEFGAKSKYLRTAEFLQERATPPNAMNMIWHALEERLGPTATNAVIRRAGYDAIAYPGGALTGGTKHNALAVLNHALLKRGGGANPRFAGSPRPVHSRPR